MRISDHLVALNSRVKVYHSNAMAYVIRTGVLVQTTEGAELTKTVASVYLSPDFPAQALMADFVIYLEDMIAASTDTCGSQVWIASHQFLDKKDYDDYLEKVKTDHQNNVVR